MVGANRWNDGWIIYGINRWNDCVGDLGKESDKHDWANTDLPTGDFFHAFRNSVCVDGPAEREKRLAGERVTGEREAVEGLSLGTSNEFFRKLKDCCQELYSERATPLFTSPQISQKWLAVAAGTLKCLVQSRGFCCLLHSSVRELLFNIMVLAL